MMDLYRLDSTFGPALWSATGIFFFFLLEYAIPFRPGTLSKLRRWRINFSLLLFNLVLVDLCFVYLLRKIEIFSGQHNLDILNAIELSHVWRIAITVLVFDLVTYYWHRLNHVVPFLWRFHQVHHSDRNIDVSSAARFHFVEMTISTVITYVLMLILGATIVEVRIFQVVLTLMAQFCHSNLKIWDPLDRVLWWVVVPPSMHRIHHSDVQLFTDSNYGTILSVWDRVLGTLRNDIAQEDIVFGLKQYTDERKLLLNELLVMPFKNRKNQKRG